MGTEETVRLGQRSGEAHGSYWVVIVAAGMLLSWWAETGVVEARAGGAGQSDPVMIAVTLVDAQSDGVMVRGRMIVAVVNLTGVAIRSVVLRLERPSPSAVVEEGIPIGDIDGDGTSVAEVEAVLDQAFAVSDDAYVFKVGFVDASGNPGEAVVTVERVTRGGL